MALIVIAIVCGLLVRETAIFWRRTAVERKPMALRYVGVPVVALTLQALVVGRLGAPFRPILVVCTTAAVTAWLLFNVGGNDAPARRLALVTIALGSALNLIPMLQFGAMPVDATALRDAGFSSSENITSGHLSKHVRLSHEDAPFLADRIAIPWLRTVLSIGDFVELGGVVLLVSTQPKGNGQARSRRRYATRDGAPMVRNDWPVIRTSGSKLAAVAVRSADRALDPATKSR